MKIMITTMAANMYLVLTLPQKCPKHMYSFTGLCYKTTSKHRAGTEKVTCARVTQLIGNSLDLVA